MLYRFYVGMISLKRRKKKATGQCRESETCKGREREPSRGSLISSMHFKPDDFVRRLDFSEKEGILRTSWLKENRFSIDSCSCCWI